MSIAERVRARVLNAKPASSNDVQPKQAPAPPPEPEAPAEMATLVARVAARFAKTAKPTV
jgi:hypothetical protein